MNPLTPEQWMPHTLGTECHDSMGEGGESGAEAEASVLDVIYGRIPSDAMAALFEWTDNHPIWHLGRPSVDEDTGTHLLAIWWDCDREHRRIPSTIAWVGGQWRTWDVAFGEVKNLNEPVIRIRSTPDAAFPFRWYARRAGDYGHQSGSALSIWHAICEAAYYAGTRFDFSHPSVGGD